MFHSLKNWFVHIKRRQIQKASTQKISRVLESPFFAEKIYYQKAHVSLGSWIQKEAGSQVLELGCGPGFYVATLSQLGFQVVGVDPYRFPSWDMIEKKTGATLQDGVKAEDLPFADESFDQVACLNAMLYFDDPGKALDEIRRVLKPGGRFIVRTISRTNLYTRRTGQYPDPASKNVYTLDELKEFVKSHGFTVVEGYSYYFLPSRFTNFWWYLHCVWLPTWCVDFFSWLTPKKYHCNVTCHAYKV